MKQFLPSDYSPPLNPEEFIVPAPEQTGGESVLLDVLFIGAGPAALSCAVKLADLAKAAGRKLEIGLMEKADRLGGHTLSGAVVNPVIFQQLFPEKSESDWPLRKKVTKESFYFLTKNLSIPLPVPPDMRNRDCRTASLCEAVRWLGAEAEQRGVHIFTSFPAEKLLTRKGRVVGAASKAFGVNKDGSKAPSFEPSSCLFAKAVVLAEGSRGCLTEAYLAKEQISRRYPQTYALGVKEIWEVEREPDRIFHTIAYPLGRSVFGGSWFYGLGGNLVSLGLVAGLDSSDGGLSVYDKLQLLKRHPLFAPWLKGGKRVEWGAKTIPEGGWRALPERLYGDGILILGDGAGFVNMASLKGVHYAMASGIFAAETLFTAFKKGDFSKDVLKIYQEKIRDSFIKEDLCKFRNLRQSFHKGLFRGLLKAGLITLTRGRLPLDFKDGELLPDTRRRRFVGDSSVKETGKREAVYLSGNKTRDQIPSHLRYGKNIPREVGGFYERMCPAGVYEWKDGLIVNAPDCIDCKATDVLGPRWTPRERGSGPDYRQM